MKFRISLWMLVFVLGGSLSCGPKEALIPERGKEKCNHCSMAIVDMRFHSQLLTDKGRRYYFDSIECLYSYKESLELERFRTWVTDYENVTRMLSEEEAAIVQSEEIHSPMGKGLAAFSSLENAREYLKNHKGSILTSEANQKRSDR
ncbi:nitrous oxide reductase accessory protein NosL [Leptospira sp. 201903070]|uniref:Nitrous oxide reductase accessory protein NosL n=1 Tax=Leptospira ainlahdjerensis TaxID=2810033 RepID=A0ABS2UH75_9LEPT|nr:nitrous oxide reductase accessory protein NosL [Leptospira ainlahdjerensis]MBM9579745.1 nitrous oxide reductase accessory protein NosL [Leptospira ainlahdjerensis]